MALPVNLLLEVWCGMEPPRHRLQLLGDLLARFALLAIALCLLVTLGPQLLALTLHSWPR